MKTDRCMLYNPSRATIDLLRTGQLASIQLALDLDTEKLSERELKLAHVYERTFIRFDNQSERVEKLEIDDLLTDTSLFLKTIEILQSK